MPGILFTQTAQFNTDILGIGTNTLLKRRPTDVFLSHKMEDKDSTYDIARALASRGISAYVDFVDPQANAEDPNLESYLRGIIHSCKSMLVVVTAKTINSWWVPFELGVALDNDKLVGTVLRGRPGELPSYLLNWPVMESNATEVAKWWGYYLSRGAHNVYGDWQLLSKAATRNFTRWTVV